MEVARVRFAEGLLGGVLFALGHAGLQRLRSRDVDGVLSALVGALFALVWTGVELQSGRPTAGLAARTVYYASRKGGRGTSERFARFGEQARRALSFAQEEAQRLNHNWIGTEHWLLGLMRVDEGIAALALAELGVQIDRVREAVLLIVGPGDRMAMGERGLTPRAKRSVELAVEEARRRGHGYVGPEHLLLGLLEEGHGVAVGVLETLGASREAIRAAVERRMGQGQGQG